jgi:hypothetical protein
MSYASKESSIAEGIPFECYEFVTPIGTFRYTSLTEDVTLGGNLYEPCEGIGRTEADINPVIDSLQTMDFIIPRDDRLAKGFSRKNLPEYCTTRVYRAHWGEDLSTQFKVEWRGEATGYSYDDDGAFIIATQSILQAKVQGSQCTIYTQLSCNHRVYDERCGIDQGDHTFSTTVTLVSGITITLDDQPFSNPDLTLGKIINDRTGEERTIFQALSGVITITYPFVDIVIGDTVSVVRGCNNLMSTCISRFNNVERFLGFRYVPLDNIFADSGDKVVVTTTTKRNRLDTQWSIGAVGLRYS